MRKMAAFAVVMAASMQAEATADRHDALARGSRVCAAWLALGRAAAQRRPANEPARSDPATQRCEFVDTQSTWKTA